MLKLKKIIICLIILIPFTGCWDRQEINDIAIVMGTSFDKSDDRNYKTAIIAPLPGQMGGPGGGGGGTSGEAAYYLDAGIGTTVRDANQNLQQRMPRKLMLGHRRVALFGEELAKEGLGKALDVLTRTTEARLTMQIFVTEGEAIEVLSAEPQLETISAEAIREIGVSGFELTLRDFLLEFQQKGNDPIIPVVRARDNISPNKNLVKQQVEINNLAIFKGDKLAFFTNELQTLGASWLMEKLVGKIYTVQFDEDTHVSIEVIENKTNFDYKIQDNLPQFNIEVNVTGDILENETDFTFEEEGAYKEINAVVEKQIKNEISEILDATLPKGIDTFGLGWLLHRREREKWKEFESQWAEILPDVEHEVNVICSVKLPGLVTEGIGIGE
ncbi:Ger(x)C family germination protein [Evansella vedderi]|uniref:Ger(X)C family germination protein n=1 Tax=Evansella vedderi TaxID=38282 RepID=A0ABU0A475_9BACI|nr:Ger(x)C family spore germination protein [Evansella vedderi]MDQ0257904.1 Ger(x)C family germination protein [Evansella vedderi]